MKRMMLFLMMCALLGFAQADLAVTNGDFETGGGENIEDVTDWYEYNTGNFWEGAWQTNASWITPNISNVVVFSSYESDDFGAPSTNPDDGSYLYQSIGTAGGLTSVQISFDWGAPDDDPGSRDLGLTVGIYAYDGSGGFTAADGTDVRGAAGVTLLDSASFEYTTDGTDDEIFSASATLDLSGAGSQELFLRFNGYNASTTESWPILDNIQLLVLDAVILHDPDDGETDVAIDLSDRTIANNLSWTAPSDPNIAEIKGYDLFVDPNETKVATRDSGCQIVDSTAGGVTQYDPTSNFGYLETLNWVVDTRYTRDDDPNLGTPDETIYVGSPSSPWSFETVSAAPIIQTYDSVVVTESMLPASLSAVVTDADGNLGSAVFTLLTDDVNWANPGSYTLTPNVSDPYAPSFTFTADTPGYYKIKLTVSDGTNTVDGRAEVAIYDDPNACAAAQFAPSWDIFNEMDFDEDCDVDLVDFATYALQWLDDRSLQAPENYDWYIPYEPVINGVINGNFELGDFTGWWTSDDDVAITDVSPLEGAYSAEWTTSTDTGHEEGTGIAYYFPVQASTAYTVTLWIAGGDGYAGTGDNELGIRTGSITNFVYRPNWTASPTGQQLTLPFVTGAADEGAAYELIIFGKTVGTYYKVDDVQISPSPY